MSTYRWCRKRSLNFLHAPGADVSQSSPWEGFYALRLSGCSWQTTPFPICVSKNGIPGRSRNSAIGFFAILRINLPILRDGMWRNDTVII